MQDRNSLAGKPFRLMRAHLLDLLHVSMSVGVMMGAVAHATAPKHASSNSRRMMAAWQQQMLLLNPYFPYPDYCIDQ